MVTRKPIPSRGEWRIAAPFHQVLLAYLQFRPMLIYACDSSPPPGIPKGYMLLMLDYEDAIDQTAETALLTARVRSFERYAKDYATVLADEGSVRFRRFVRGKSPSDKAMVFGSLDAVVILDWLDADGRMRSGVNADWWLYHTSALADADTDLYQSYIGREVGSIRIQRDGESVLVRVDALKPIMERCEQIARMLAPQQALTPDQRTEWRSKSRRGRKPIDDYARLAALKDQDPLAYERARQEMIARLAGEHIVRGIDADKARRLAADTVRQGVYRAALRAKG